MPDYNYSEIITLVVKCATLSAASYFLCYQLLKHIDGSNNKQNIMDTNEGKEKLRKLRKEQLSLSEHELCIASQLICPEDITVSWDNIAGLDETITSLYETVIFPLKHRDKFKNSKLTQAPKGVLLYGPPGCGKTMIATATAKEAVASFINLDVSMLTDKYYGESQKFVAAVFSLAEKIQPCVIFIDEIDSLLRTRSSTDHEATAMMKAQFMFLWDGLSTDSEKAVIVMGATNRPNDLDAAIIRRMPATFRIPLPNHEQRNAILELILSSEEAENINYEEITKKTVGYSGSDLKELCRNASMIRVREKARSKNSTTSDEENCILRPISMDDVRKALHSMGNAKLEAPRYVDMKLD